MSMLQKFAKQTCNLRSALLRYNNTNALIAKKRFLSFTSLEYTKQKNPAPLYFNKDVQQLLKTLTRVDLKRVYRKRRTGDKALETPTYKFMTEAQLQEALQEAKDKVEELLQMPPVVPVQEHIDNVYSEDPALQGYGTAKFVFTDISYGLKDKDRLITVRDTDGTLKDADWDVRTRMNNLYFPKMGRSLIPPRLFSGKFFEDSLQKGEYEYILDRACIQFDPNDAEYQRVTSAVYQHISANNLFDSVRSTRHFGPLAFFLTWFKMVDNLLLNLIETGHVEEAESLVDLYAKLHDVSLELGSESGLNKIDKFIEKFSSKRGPLELAMQAYREFDKERTSLQRGLDIAHGRA